MKQLSSDWDYRVCLILINAQTYAAPTFLSESITLQTVKKSAKTTINNQKCSHFGKKSCLNVGPNY